MIEMMYLKEITENTSELDVFEESSKLFTLKNWSSKAVPINETFDVLADMLKNENNISDRMFDV